MQKSTLENIKNILRHGYHLRGWHTKRKIVVIESDDWGSIRMPSVEIYNRCLSAGYPVDKNPYERYDSLLSKSDLDLLFSLLLDFKDKNGNPPVITANCVVANPDFRRIKENKFKEYYYELITDTFNSYPQHQGNLEVWKEGLINKIFFPQFHAREHLNISLFMTALKEDNEDALFAFTNKMPGITSRIPGTNGNLFVESTNYNSVEDKAEKLGIIIDGLSLFEKLFGYKSESIIPPNYIWSPDFNGPIFNKGVNIIQGIRKYREPMPGKKQKSHSTYIGKKSNYGQINLVRNVVFEPSLFSLGIRDSVDRCLADMNMAFKLSKPAVISSHRINYSGFIDIHNRDRTLSQLGLLLTSALRKWPDIEFMTSKDLGHIILDHNKHHVKL